MHKDLNCVKLGAKALEEMWILLNKTPPILLANKENAYTLANQTNASVPMAAEAHAEQVLKWGGTHATSLGGMLFQHKDNKKGQQDTYDWYMEYHIGYCVPYPDVSNTRYGSHGEAVATIVIYLEHFKNFMKHIHDVKDRPGKTNIEKNFASTIEDILTLTELCVLALYNIAVSRPFMAHIRTHSNILKLQGFFERKAKFLETIIENPGIWTGGETSHKQGSLDGKEWDKWALQVLTAVHALVPHLPDLDSAVTVFARGAREAFVNRFSDEFKEGGGIDQLMEDERDELYFSSTNDSNEGGLGSWRHGQARQPSEMLHKFNAHFMSSQNHTESFMLHKLTKEADHIHLMHTARQRDASGLQKQRKAAQMEADKIKVTENRQKAAKQQEQRENKAAVVCETARNFVLTDAGIAKLTKDNLNLQLDCHHELEKKLQAPIPISEGEGTIASVPLKSHMKNNEEQQLELKKAVTRFIAQGLTVASAQVLLSVMENMTVGGDENRCDSDEDDI